MAKGFVGGRHVEAGDALDQRVGNHRIGVRSDHAVESTRVGPIGKPAAFAVGIQPARDDLAKLLGIDDAVEGKLGAKGVPQPGIRIGHSVVDPAVPGTVMHLLPLGIEFVKAMRKFQRAVEARVEGLLLLFRGGDVDPLQLLFPGGRRAGPHRFESARSFRLQIPGCLLQADVGRGDANLNDRFFGRVELHVAAHAGLMIGTVGFLCAAGKSSRAADVTIQFPDEIEGEIPGTAASCWHGP